MKKIKISPSILSADFSQLGAEIKRLEDGGADMIHVDVMDGHFVPNLTIGPPVIKALKKNCSIKFDVHLMISPVHKYIEAYSNAGADIITIHPEATDNLRESILKIKNLNKITFEFPSKPTVHDDEQLTFENKDYDGYIMDKFIGLIHQILKKDIEIEIDFKDIKKASDINETHDEFVQLFYLFINIHSIFTTNRCIDHRE